jgi:hypothetical protein
MRSSNAFHEPQSRKKIKKVFSKDAITTKLTSGTMLGYVYDPWCNPPPVMKKARKTKRIPRPAKKQAENPVKLPITSITAKLILEEYK